jgi:hypothetical protein
VDNVFFHLSNPSPVLVPDEYQTGGTTILNGREEMMTYLPFACQPFGLPWVCEKNIGRVDKIGHFLI